MTFSFLTAGEILFGRGAASAVPDRIATLGRRVLLVQGATPSRSDGLASALEARDLSVLRRPVAAEPDVALVESLAAAAREHRSDAVVSLGGGAVIDAGKAAAALALAAGGALRYLEVVGEGLPLEAAPLPFVAIPSTAGTGAEVTKTPCSRCWSPGGRSRSATQGCWPISPW